MRAARRNVTKPCAVPRPFAMPMRALLGTLVLALCACAAVPPLASPNQIAVPGNWSGGDFAAADQASSLAQWWRRFDDPLLADLVGQAMQANTSIQSAQARLRSAWALRDVAAAGLAPTLGASASAQHGTAGGSSTGNHFNAGLDGSWNLDLFGARRAALRASDALALASSASLGDVQVAIAAEVALDYISLRGAQIRLAIARANLASQLETLQITRWRQQAGLVTEIEAEQGRGLTEQTRAQLPVLLTSIAQSQHALAVLTGQAPAALLPVLAATGPLPRASDDLLLSFPAQTLRQRPDVRAAELQVTAALAQVAQAEAARAPNFQLGGSLGLSAVTLGALSNSAAVVSSLLASVSVPLFDGGAGRNQVRVQQSALQIAQVAYQAVLLTALKDVEDALVALQGDRERLLRLQLAADAADNAARLAEQRYASGLVDFQTVLETQRSRLNTQDGLASSGADLAADHVRLYKALGGGWNPDAITPRTGYP